MTSGNLITFLLTVEYDGTSFCGFQRTTHIAPSSHPTDISSLHLPFKHRNLRGQNNNEKIPIPSIQDALERALYQLASCRLPIPSFKVRSVGRTDKGVHAKEQMVCFDYSFPSTPQKQLQEEQLQINLNRKGHGSNSNEDLLTPPSKKVKKQNPVKKTTNYDILFQSCVDKKDLNVKNLRALLRAFNSYLPDDVVVRSIQRCRTNLQPRKEPSWKTYVYRIRYESIDGNNGKGTDVEEQEIKYGGRLSIRSPFDNTFTWTCPWPLDSSKLEEMCQTLSGEHDYSNFVHKKERNNKSNVMKVNIWLEKEKPQQQEGNEPTKSNDPIMGSFSSSICTVKIHCKSKDGFRRSMVRNLVGFIVDMSRNKLGDRKDEIMNNIFVADNATADLVHSAPACGLCLEKVDFIDNVFNI